MPPEPKNTSASTDAMSSHHLRVRAPLIYGLITAFVVFVGALSYLPILQQKQVVEESVVLTPAVSSREEFKGKVYLSLAPLTEDGFDTLGLYSFDTVSGDLDEVAKSPTENFLTSKISPDGSKIAVVKGSEDMLRLYVGDASLQDLEEVALDASFNTVRSPSWSPDGTKVAFMARDNATDFDVEKWTVFVFDLTSKETWPVSKGVNPNFLPDETLIVLREDGLYTVTLDGGATRIVTLSAKATSNMKLDVSRDGKYLAWSDPMHETLSLSEVSSWAPFSIATTTTLRDGAFWPVFSPKGEYVAYQSFDWSTSTSNPSVENYRLLFYSLREKKWMEQSLGLTSFYQDALYITDWQ